MSEALLIVGKQIKSARISKNLSVNKISDNLQLPPKYLQKIEVGSLDEELELNNVIRYLKLYLQHFNMDYVTIISNYKYQILHNRNKKKKSSIFSNKLILSNQNYIVISVITLLILLLFFFYFEISEKQNSFTNLSDESEILLRNT